MHMKYSRRRMLIRTGQAVASGAIGFPFLCLGKAESRSSPGPGTVVGNIAGSQAGLKVLADGGNAIDAAVAAALTSCISGPNRCGIGGYGGHMVVAMAGHRPVSIDYNTMAPAAATPDMYPLDEKGNVIGRINFTGWKAAGVPGVLAGMQMALDNFGTRSFREIIQPAIKLAREGAVVDRDCALDIREAVGALAKFPDSAKLYLRSGEPLNEGELMSNPELAEMLETLAKRNSVESFYRGDIAQRIAEAFRKSDGLVTAKDLAAYHARKVKPLEVEWKDARIFTAPLTAGGLTVLETLQVLHALGWSGREDSPEKTHARLEAMRLAWKDRLELLGDPEKVKVPVRELLSAEHAHELAQIADEAVKAGKPVDIKIQQDPGHGTTNISAADCHGNLVAMTLTHGAGFGSKVTVEGLGLTLGHGMVRFNPHPDHPNSPGPGKRPLHNMCPTVVLRGDKKGVNVAVGGAGGVKIPNGVLDFIIDHVLENRSIQDAMAAPRINTTGTLEVMLEKAWPPSDVEYLGKIGFKASVGAGAHLSAVSFDGATGDCGSAAR
jgi:gamma-glutamyltranspeptidase/glutathione hydrolase